MTRRLQQAAMSALAAFALSALVGPGCASGDASAFAPPEKLAEAQKARRASIEGEAGGLAKSARRR